MKIEVNLDKILKELNTPAIPRYKGDRDKNISYRDCITLKMWLEGHSCQEIATSMGLKTSQTITSRIRKIKDTFSIPTFPAERADVQLAMLCYERGYVVIHEEV